MINLELKEGMYVRYVPTLGEYIQKISKITKMENRLLDIAYYLGNESKEVYSSHFDEIINASFNLIELVEYMDLLEIENPVKLYGEDRKISLFNPVRCDGFTEFENGTHCIILNLDYLVDVKDLKIKSVLTKEQFNACKYVVERDK